MLCMQASLKRLATSKATATEEYILNDRWNLLSREISLVDELSVSVFLTLRMESLM